MMKKWIFNACMLVLLYIAPAATQWGGVKIHAQTTETPAQKNVKKEKKKRMRDAARADRSALKRHQDIQTKDTRKRMKKHLKKTKKNVKNKNR